MLCFGPVFVSISMFVYAYVCQCRICAFISLNISSLSFSHIPFTNEYYVRMSSVGLFLFAYCMVVILVIYWLFTYVCYFFLFLFFIISFLSSVRILMVLHSISDGRRTWFIFTLTFTLHIAQTWSFQFRFFFALSLCISIFE